MSIRNAQLNKAQNEAITSSLKKGVIPTSRSITSEVEQKTAQRPFGAPETQLLQVAEYSVSDKDAYNKLFKSVENDLSIAFEEQNRVIRSANKMLDYYDASKTKLQGLVDSVWLTFDNFSEGEYSDGWVENFKDFFKLELDGNADRNIPATNAFVNLESGVTQLPTYPIQNSKVNLSKGMAKVTSLTGTLNVSGENANGVLNDTKDDLYICSITKDEDGPAVIQMKVTLPQAVMMNNIYQMTKTMAKAKATCSISADDIHYRELQTIDYHDMASWAFANQEVKYIIIDIELEHADGYVDGKYLYNIVFRNISAYKDIYITKAVLCSKPFEADKVLPSVILSPVMTAYPETSIEYYVGVDNDLEPVDWLKAEPGEPVNLHLMHPEQQLVNKYTDGFGTHENGMYMLCKLPDNTDVTSVKVRPGFQMMMIKRYTVDKDILTPALQYESKLDYTSYIKCDDYFIPCKESELTVLSQLVYCDKATTVSGKWIKYADHHHVAINNVILTANNDEYSFKLNKGWNQIEIQLLCNVEKAVQHNFNFVPITPTVYADKDWTYNNEINLKIKEDGFCCVDGKIYIAHNPFLLSMADGGINITVSYNTVIGDHAPTKVRVMCVLETVNTGLTPFLLNYTLKHGR